MQFHGDAISWRGSGTPFPFPFAPVYFHFMATREHDGRSGRWLVIGILSAAVLLGLIALKFRRPTRDPNSTTLPSTIPATMSDE
jgi:hypothetical protein